MSDNRLSLTAGVSEVFNYALYINDISPVRGLQIRNPGPDPAAGVKLKITSSSPIFEDYEEVLPDIPAGKPVALTDPVLAVRSSALAKLTESEKTQLTIRLVSPGEEGDGAADKDVLYGRCLRGLFNAFQPVFLQRGVVVIVHAVKADDGAAVHLL